VTVWPDLYYGWGPKELKYRFPWTFPILFSPHDPNIIYTSGNLVFRSTDEGSSWEAISPDLTRDDPDKLEASGGPLTLDTSGAEHYGTIFAFVESPHEAGTFWAGSDDGLIHLSRDNGQSWQNVTPPDLLEWSLISIIEASPHDPATVYVAVTRYKLEDYQPYLYKTTDYGQSWQKISDSFPQEEITRVIRVDPARPGLLYVGTETGIFISFDDGANWQRFNLNLPVVPVYDLALKENDLVAATHGRSFWILDDITPLHQLAGELNEAPARLFKPRPTYRRWVPWGLNLFRGPGKNYMAALGSAVTFYDRKSTEGEEIRAILDGGENPPQGVLIFYTLKDKPEEEITLTFLDKAGAVIKSFSNKTKENNDPTQPKDERRLPAEAGMNRFVWNMRYPDATKVPGDLTTESGSVAPLAPPGSYQVQLKVGDQTYTQSFEIHKDPRVTATPADFEAQFELWQRIRDKFAETQQAINRLRRVKQQLKSWVTHLDRAEGLSQQIDLEAVREAAETAQEKLEAIETELIQTGAKTSSDRLRLKVRLNAKLAGLISIVSCADAAPPKQAYAVFEHLSAQVDDQLAQLQAVLETDVANFNRLLQEAQVPPVVA
jgi:hypothetical protein